MSLTDGANFDHIKTATWNVFYGTGVDKLKPILKSLIDDGVVLLAMQEAHGKDIAGMVSDAGLDFYQAGEGLVAWNPKWFTLISRDLIDLSKVNYFSDKGREVDTTMPSVILCDQWGRTIFAGSYHTPSFVEKNDISKVPPRRLAVIKEATQVWGQIAKDSQTRAVWLAGDDNLDESRLRGSAWAFWLKANGLTEVQPPSPTHGHAVKGRKIDSMRVRGLKAVTPGSVRAGGGDHRVHVRLLRWA